MRKGCGLGCGVVFLLACAAGAGLLYLLHGAGAFENYPSQPVDLAFNGPTAVSVRVDLEAPGTRALLSSLIDDAPDARTRFLLESLPWQGALSFAPDRDSRMVHLQAALSLRRLSGLLASRSSTELWRWFAGQKVASLALEQPGLWVARSTLPIRDAAHAETGARWPMKANPPLEAPAEGLLSFQLDNRDGGAYLCMEPILNPPPQPGTEITGKPPVLDARGWAAYFERLEQASGAVSLEDAGAAVATVRVQARNALAARELRALLERERDRAAAWLEGYGAYLEGAWMLEGATVSGSFRVEQAVPLTRRAIRGEQP